MPGWRATLSGAALASSILGSSILGSSILGSPAAGAAPATPAAAPPQAYPIGVVTVATRLQQPPRRTPLEEVDWDSGWGPREKALGLPNPKGWYRALMGRPGKSKVIYLTFDDGPAPGYTPKLLDLLERNDARATFFVLGVAAAGQSKLIKRMHREGHAVANHTWDHPELTTLTAARVREQLKDANRAVGSAMGACMRPPFGRIDETVADAALDLNLAPVLWTGHIEDWNTHPVSWYVQRLRAATRPGAIILMHDTHATTLAAVAQMLPQWRKQGYRLAAIPRCLQSP